MGCESAYINQISPLDCFGSPVLDDSSVESVLDDEEGDAHGTIMMEEVLGVADGREEFFEDDVLDDAIQSYFADDAIPDEPDAHEVKMAFDRQVISDDNPTEAPEEEEPVLHIPRRRSRSNRKKSHWIS